MTERAQLWLVYFTDYSDFFVFDDELAALRHAVENHMEARRIEPGESLRGR